MPALTSPRWPLPLALYALAGRALTPALSLYLKRRVSRGKEDPARLGERFGHASLARPEGKLVWVHAASVGEMLATLELIKRLAAQSVGVLLTTGTLTSAELSAQRLPPGAFHQFVPLDVPQAARRFLDHWKPDLAIFVESEFWPNLMRGCYQRSIPLGIVNGRMSERSFRRWEKRLPLARAMLEPLSFCLAQSEGDAARLAALGAPARAAGNLKFDSKALPVDAGARDALALAIGNRPILLAASTHPGEEAQVLEASAMLRNTEPELLTIIVPRHPERGDEIAALAASGGMAAQIRSKGETPDDLTPLYIADTLGELGLFYALATVAFVGGSLVETGGHNPIEPARLGAPIITGPNVKNFSDIFAEFIARGAAIKVEDSAGLAREASRIIADKSARQTLKANARAVAEANAGAVDTALEAVLHHLGAKA